jgi:hypothetical protein
VPSVVNTSSKSLANLSSRSLIKNRKPPARSPQVERQVAGLLCDPAGRRVRRDIQYVDPPQGMLRHGEAVQPREHDRLAAEEVTGQDPGRLGFEELALSRITTSRRWTEAGLL